MGKAGERGRDDRERGPQNANREDKLGTDFSEKEAKAIGQSLAKKLKKGATYAPPKFTRTAE
ncbi:MAG: hypothetical protein ACRDHS_04885 [Actinomycetota bacterium]